MTKKMKDNFEKFLVSILISLEGTKTLTFNYDQIKETLGIEEIIRVNKNGIKTNTSNIN